MCPGFCITFQSLKKFGVDWSKKYLKYNCGSAKDISTGDESQLNTYTSQKLNKSTCQQVFRDKPNIKLTNRNKLGGTIRSKCERASVPLEDHIILNGTQSFIQQKSVKKYGKEINDKGSFLIMIKCALSMHQSKYLKI